MSRPRWTLGACFVATCLLAPSSLWAQEPPKKSVDPLLQVQVLVGLGQYDRALAAAKAASDENPDSRNLVALGAAELALGNFNEAGQAYYRAS